MLIALLKSISLLICLVELSITEGVCKNISKSDSGFLSNFPCSFVNEAMLLGTYKLILLDLLSRIKPLINVITFFTFNKAF